MDTPRLLLFEENYQSMYRVKEYLEEELGWYVELTAAKGILERLSIERFDLLVVDVMIQPVSFGPDGREVENVHFDNVSWLSTGIEFTRRLRRGEFGSGTGSGTAPHVPVLLLSSLPAHSVRSEIGDDIAVQAVLEKPFRLEDLRAQIQATLQE